MPSRFPNLSAAALLAASLAASAAEVNLIGLFPGKAVVVIDKGAPRTLSVGQKTAEGVVLVSVADGSAVFEIDGKRESLLMGQHFESAASTGSRNTVTLAADSRGHFMTLGQVNGVSVQFLVDTGATMIAFSAAEARRIGIDYAKGARGMSQTANGVVPVYRVRLDSVKLGDVTLLGVEAVVLDGAGLDTALLGNSFLNRVEMRREGQTLTLTKRF